MQLSKIRRELTEEHKTSLTIRGRFMTHESCVIYICDMQNAFYEHICGQLFFYINAKT